MTSRPALLEPAHAQGFALCTAGGVLIPHSFRLTREASIASVFSCPEHVEAAWEDAQAQGWSVELVYAQVWTPIFQTSVLMEVPA